MNAVIKPWLVAGLVVALAGNVLLSGVLIVKLGRFDYSKRQAEEAEARAATQRTEAGRLQVEVESLTKQKDALAPTVADWQQRIKEKSAAEAVLATIEAKQHQAELDIAQASKRLDEVSRALLDADKQKGELISTVERLKAERDALKMSNTDAKALARQAEEAERRINAATNALANVDAQRKQLETDASAAQTRFDQIQKEADALRQDREKLSSELPTLRQLIQALKDQLPALDQKAAELKAMNAALQQAQQQSVTAEARTREMESRYEKAASDYAQLTNRFEQARKEATEAEARLDAGKAELRKAAQELGASQKLIAETQASQDQLSREQAKLTAQVAASKKDLEQSRKEAAEAETRLEAAKSNLQKADADTSAGRTQLQVFVVKQGELTREISRLEDTVKQLRAEKEAIEKETGRQEALRVKAVK